MQYPQFSDSEFLSAAVLNAAASVTANSADEIGLALHTPGLANAGALTINPSGLTITITAGSSFRVLFSSGVIAGANGTSNGSTTNVYTVNLASLVPGSGSVAVYVVATLTTIQQGAYQVVGPPPGHPDYDPTFAPYTAYSSVLNSLVISGTTTPPDNMATIEIFRLTLNAGQTSITSVNTLFQQRVGALLSRNQEVLSQDLAAGAAATNVGTLGGVLTGTLPNPGLAAGAASSNIGTLGGVLTGTLPNPGMAAGAAVANIGFTPVQQGGGTGQGTNKVYIGWTGTKLAAQVDASNLGNLALESWVTSNYVSDATFGYYVNQQVLTSSAPSFYGITVTGNSAYIGQAIYASGKIQSLGGFAPGNTQTPGANTNNLIYDGGQQNIIFVCGPTGNIVFQMLSNGNGIAQNGDWINGSAADTKEDIQPVADALATVNKLQGLDFTRKATKTRSSGVTAEQIREVLPHLVHRITHCQPPTVTHNDAGEPQVEQAPEEETLGVNYIGLSAYFIEAIKELSGLVVDLQKTVADLTAKQAG
jgi:hypothetical protein